MFSVFWVLGFWCNNLQLSDVFLLSHFGSIHGHSQPLMLNLTGHHGICVKIFLKTFCCPSRPSNPSRLLNSRHTAVPMSWTHGTVTMTEPWRLPLPQQGKEVEGSGSWIGKQGRHLRRGQLEAGVHASVCVICFFLMYIYIYYIYFRVPKSLGWRGFKIFFLMIYLWFEYDFHLWFFYGFKLWLWFFYGLDMIFFMIFLWFF